MIVLIGVLVMVLSSLVSLPFINGIIAERANSRAFKKRLAEGYYYQFNQGLTRK